VNTKALPIASLSLLLALCLAACGESGSESVEAPPDTGPKSAAETVAWDPDLLKPLPGERVVQPGTGDAWLEGRVVDEEGRPIAGATVELHAMPTGRGTGSPPLLHASATADNDGAFRVGPGPSPWWRHGILSAYAPGYCRTALRSRSSTVGDLAWADPGAPATLELREGVEVSGNVRTSAGAAPFKPVLVWALSDHSFFEVVETDASGAFSMLVHEGEVLLNVVAGAYEPTRTSVTASADAKPHPTLVVDEAPDLRGRVVDHATGRPVAGAAVRGFYGETLIVRSGADGSFVLPRYWFRAFQVRAPGYAERIHQLAMERDVTAEVEVRLRPGIVARGVVQDLDGRPLGGVRVRSFLRDKSGDWVDLIGPVTGEDGTYTFVGLPTVAGEGELRVFGEKEGWALGTSAALRELGGGALVDDVTVSIPRLVSVTGVIRDEKNRSHPGNIDIQWDQPAGLAPYADVYPTGVRTRAEEDGTWTAQIPERVSYRAEAKGDASLPATLEARSPAHSEETESQVEIPVRAGLSIRGVVVDADGLPVSRGKVLVEPSPFLDDRPSKKVFLRKDGTFDAGGLEPGLYDFSVVSDPELLKEVALGIEAGADRVTVRMRRAGGVTGRVVLEDGSLPDDVPHVVVEGLEETRPLPGRRQAQVRRADRVFRMGPLSPGPYRVTVRCGDHRLDVESVEVKEREPTNLGDLVLQPSGVLTGTVTVGGDVAAEGVVDVFLLRDSGTRLNQGTFLIGSDGVYRAGALLPGRHVVSVRPFGAPRLERTVDVVTGEVQSVDLPIQAGATLELTAVDAEGEPVSGARVTISRPDGSSLEFWKRDSRKKGPHATGKDGKLTCTGIPPGPCRIFVDLPARGTGEAVVELDDKSTSDLRVIVTR
jgi:protocatechuate 3,4-dioxygenase beta subunit